MDEKSDPKIIEKLEKIQTKLDEMVSSIKTEKQESQKSPEEKSDPVDEISIPLERTFESLEEFQKTADHTIDMLDGLIAIHQMQEYRREYGEIAYRRKYFGDHYG